MSEMAKAIITVGNTVVTFEGPQEFVDNQVQKYMSRSGSSDISINSDMPSRSSGLNGNGPLTEKDAVQAKRPQGHSEIVAVLAFVMTESGAAEFTEEDIRRAYLRAGVKPPKVVGQAIRDAKNNFDFVAAGSKRGTYRLTNHGDRTVRFDLPRTKDGKE
jgi:hypothetical protein